MTNTEAGSGQRIVVGFDGSEASVHALHWAAHQAALTGSTLEVVTTWEWPTSYGWAIPLPTDYDPAADAANLLDEGIAEVRKAVTDVDVRSTVVEGRPAPILVQASRDADLLVIGSRGHGEFAGMLLGSVSEHCATHAHCPVLIHRAKSTR